MVLTVGQASVRIQISSFVGEKCARKAVSLRMLLELIQEVCGAAALSLSSSNWLIGHERRGIRRRGGGAGVRYI